MKASNPWAPARLASVFCFLALNLTGATLLADGWQNDIQFEPCECGVPDGGACCSSDCPVWMLQPRHLRHRLLHRLSPIG